MLIQSLLSIWLNLKSHGREMIWILLIISSMCVRVWLWSDQLKLISNSMSNRLRLQMGRKEAFVFGLIFHHFEVELIDKHNDLDK